jgi:hypothetical protein
VKPGAALRWRIHVMAARRLHDQEKTRVAKLS